MTIESWDQLPPAVPSACADEAVAAIEKAGGSAFAIHTDLVDPATVPVLFDTLDHEFTKRNGSKTLDIPVNNAGNAGWIG